LELLGEWSEIGCVAGHDHHRDRLEPHFLRVLLREFELDAREGDVLRGEADLHLLAARLLLDEAEREATVPLGPERRRAEDERARRRQCLARQAAAPNISGIFSVSDSVMNGL